MNKLRWTMDGGFWDVDVSTPRTRDGVARPVPGDPLPLGLTRGARLSRPKQIDFFQLFMAMPFVPSFDGGLAGNGFSLQRVLSLPLGERWFTTLLGQFNVQKFVSCIKKNGFMQPIESSWLQSTWRHLCNKSLYALHLSSELLVTPDDTAFVGIEASGNGKTPRMKAFFHHKFLHHNLTVEAAQPGLFIDQHGKYWDVPFTMAIDMSSVASESGASYHMFINHTMGSPKHFDDQPTTNEVAASLLPGLCAKGAISYKKNIDIWKSEAPKMKMVQPYDIFLSNPHISASGILGAVVTASLGDNSVRAKVENDASSIKTFSLHAQGANSAILADAFASVSLSAQHGNFQRLFLDLTRFNARLDFPSGSKFLSGASRLAHDIYKSQVPNLDAIQAVCPHATVSFQQQIAGPFSFRVDAGVDVDLKRDWYIRVREPVVAMEYALQVLGSAKAIAWYSPRQQEFMIEIRFVES